MQRFQTSDGLTLAYHDQGSGPAVLCLAGLTRNSSDFNAMLPHLRDVRLIRLDYRGRGASDFDPDYRNYTMLVEARDVLELLDHLGLAKVAIIGTSRGGLIAMLLASLAKDRLAGVLLNDIGPEIAPVGLEVIMGFLGRRPDYKTHAQAAAELPAAMPGFDNIPAERWLEEASRRWIQKDDGLHLRYDPKLRDAMLELSLTPTPDLWPLFDALEGLPLALLRGANSNLLTAETAAKMQRRRPDMMFAQVADRGHIPFLDEPESLAVIRAFLGRIT
jgi:pimeloyl-ACP methyl ester carboxylesterase